MINMIKVCHKKPFQQYLTKLQTHVKEVPQLQLKLIKREKSAISVHSWGSDTGRISPVSHYNNNNLQQIGKIADSCG